MPIIYRIEHKDCPDGNIHHGPHAQDMCNYQDSPMFGSRGPCPQEDYPSLPLHSGMRCGVMRSQVANWWGTRFPHQARTKGWKFGVYHVVYLHWFKAQYQVTFVEDEATFLGYFSSWVDEDGYLDSRYPDDYFEARFHKPNKGSVVSGHTERSALFEDSIDPLRTEEIQRYSDYYQPRLLL